MEDESLRSGVLLLLPLAIFIGLVILLRNSLLVIVLNLVLNYHLRKIRLLLPFPQTRIFFVSMNNRKRISK